MRHTIVALMEDKPGVLNRVATLFRRRNFNIDSLAVGHSEVSGISRMTIVVNGDDRTLEQVDQALAARQVTMPPDLRAQLSQLGSPAVS